MDWQWDGEAVGSVIDLLLGQVTEVEGRRFDRKPFRDPRSNAFLVREQLDLIQRRFRNNDRWWRKVNPSLDQGSSGACVGYSAATILNTTPYPYPADENLARQLFMLSIRPGETAANGSSVLYGLKAMKQLGYITDFYWAGVDSSTYGSRTAESLVIAESMISDLIDGVGYLGPMLIGMDWTVSMMETRPSGLLEMDPTSGWASGHAITCLGILLNQTLPGEGSRKFDVAVLQNTWGSDWGVMGPWGTGSVGFITLEDLHYLLARNGEGAFPVKNPVFQPWSDVDFRVDPMGVPGTALLANRNETIVRGLQNFDDLGLYDGMVFEFDLPSEMAFHAHNALMPLSIAWFDIEGEYLGQDDMEPCPTTGRCRYYKLGQPFRYVLQVPQGKLANLGITEGSRLCLV